MNIIKTKQLILKKQVVALERKVARIENQVSTKNNKLQILPSLKIFHDQYEDKLDQNGWIRTKNRNYMKVRIKRSEKIC